MGNGVKPRVPIRLGVYEIGVAPAMYNAVDVGIGDIKAEVRRKGNAFFKCTDISHLYVRCNAALNT